MGLLVWLCALLSSPGCVRFFPGTPVAVGEEALVEIQHRGCEDGYCPVYDVRIHRDGMVAFDGKRDVRCQGAYWRRNADVASVEAEIRRVDPHSVALFQGHISDGLQMVLVTRLDGVGRRMAFQPDVDPPALMRLVDRLESIAGIGRLAEPWPRYRGPAPRECP